MTTLNLLRHPSGFLPLVMSFCALGTVFSFLIVHGTAPEPDENAAAHLWQLLMAAQLPIVFFFAFKHLPEAPRQARAVLALQFFAALTALAPVYLLHW